MGDIGLPRLRARVRSVSASVKANPGMYFGAYPASDWPFVIAAWTAADLLRLAPYAPSVELTLHCGGGLSAAVSGARVTAPAMPSPRPLADVIRSGMWYTELSRATTVDAGPERAPQLTAGEHVWYDLDVTVHSELDASLFGMPDGSWWRDPLTRLGAVLATPRHRPPDGQRVMVLDETTGNTADLP
ncbi:hypothetical protein [Dactylosporangium sp. CA-092794]|uniref:hypothetical protein n=1 Tax=Dactylosporangium sp. CA-092794 TaxID=3239929 RepID=UPI003D950179